MMEILKVNNEVVEEAVEQGELEKLEKQSVLLEVKDVSEWMLTYLKAVQYAFLEYVDGEFDDPEVAFAIIREFLNKSIDGTMKINELLKQPRII